MAQHSSASTTQSHANTAPPAREPLFGLSPVQLVGGALAAISSAVVSSYLGVAGTLIGAALASIVSTVGAAVYSTSIRGAHRKLTSGIQALNTTDSLDASNATRVSPTDPATDVLVVDTRRGWWSRLGKALRAVPRRVWLGAAAVFVITVVTITAFELATGKPVSDTISGTSSGGTSIGSIIDPGSTNGDNGTSSDQPTASVTTTTEPTATTEPTPTQDGGNQPTGGDETATSAPTATQDGGGASTATADTGAHAEQGGAAAASGAAVVPTP